MKTILETPRRGAMVVCLSLVLVIAGPAILSARGANENPSTVTVLGRGEVFAEPDQAAILVGVQLFNESAQEASAEMRRRMDRVIDALLALGIPEQRIQTMNYSIYFERDYQAPTLLRECDRVPAGMYRIENMVRIMINDVGRAAEVTEAAIAAGANQMYGIEFSFSRPEALDAEARSKAMADARVRAEELATAAGRSLGIVREISEVTGTPVGAGHARLMADGYGGGPVQPGTSRYSAAVQVTWELE